MTGEENGRLAATTKEEGYKPLTETPSEEPSNAEPAKEAVDHHPLEGTSYLRRTITVEPVLFLFMIAGGQMVPALNAFTYEKICHMEFNDTSICDNLHNVSMSEAEDLVQSKSSYYFLAQTYCFEVPAIFVSFFYGAISDRYSRRLALALPIVGQMLALVCFLFNVYYFEAHVAYLFIGYLVSGFTGGWITLLLSAYSYLSEVSTTKNRTKRIAIGEATEAMSLGIAILISGIILDNTSYTFVFVLALSVNALNVVYIFTWIEEPNKHTRVTGGSILSLDEIRSSFTCVFQRRPSKGRTRILVLLSAVFASRVSYLAMNTLGYLYLRRQPLSWSQTLFGLYLGGVHVIGAVSLITALPIMANLLGMRDTSIILTAMTSGAVSEFMFGFCTKTWQVFIVPVVGFLSDARMTCMRSLLSTFVHPGELGKMFAMVGAIQSASGLLGTGLYNSIYPETLSFWPGFCFTLGVMIAIAPMAMVCWLHFDLKREDKSTKLSSIDTPESTVLNKSRAGGCPGYGTTAAG